MSHLTDLNAYLGMTIRVHKDRKITWAPNRRYGDAGLVYSITSSSKLVDLVLNEKPNGSRVRLSSQGHLSLYEMREGTRTSKDLGQITQPVDLVMDKLDMNPSTLKPGMMWTGPFDGEKHHFGYNDVWISNLDKRRCSWQNVDDKLRRAFELWKPDGGSFIINPFNHVFTLIDPEDVFNHSVLEEQWKGLTEDEFKMLQVHKERVQMLPIYIGKIETYPTLSEPLDHTQPLSASTMDELFSFINLKSPDLGSSSSSDPTQKIEEISDDDIDEILSVSEDDTSDSNSFNEEDLF